MIRLEPIDFITPKDDNPFESFLARLKEQAGDFETDSSEEVIPTNNRKSNKAQSKNTNDRKKTEEAPSLSIASVRPYDAGKATKSSRQKPNESPFGNGFDEFLRGADSFWSRSPLLERSDKLAGERKTDFVDEMSPDPKMILPQDDELQLLFSEMHSPFPEISMSEVLPTMRKATENFGLDEKRSVWGYHRSNFGGKQEKRPGLKEWAKLGRGVRRRSTKPKKYVLDEQSSSLQ